MIASPEASAGSAGVSVDASAVDRAPRSGRGVLVVVLCCGWIVAAVMARSVVTFATDSGGIGLSGEEFVVGCICLTASAVLIAGVLPLSVVGCVSGGRLLAGVIFAAAISSLVVQGRVTQWDAVAGFLCLLAIEFLRCDRWRWAGLPLLGIALGCSPLCLGGLVVVLLGRGSGNRRIVGLVFAVLVGLSVSWAIDALCNRPIGRSLALSDVAARMGPHDVWRLVSGWSDHVMAALLLALAAVSSWLVCGHSGPRDKLTGHDKALTVWLMVSFAVGVTFPRSVVDHGHLLALPAFLLAPAGWRMLSQLAFDRSHWSLCVLWAALYALPVVLLWIPIRKAGEVMLVALFPP